MKVVSQVELVKSLLLAARFSTSAFAISTLARITLASSTNLSTTALAVSTLAGVAFAAIRDTTLARVARARVAVFTGLTVARSSSSTLAEGLAFTRVTGASSSELLLNLSIHLDLSCFG